MTVNSLANAGCFTFSFLFVDLMIIMLIKFCCLLNLRYVLEEEVLKTSQLDFVKRISV